MKNLRIKTKPLGKPLSRGGHQPARPARGYAPNPIQPKLEWNGKEL
jgi:hypothetical protein